MTQEHLPRLTEAQVRQLANQQSFERGKSYYRDGTIVEPVRQGWALRAQCEGSEDEPYAVSATLTQHGIAASSCTCPYDWGGACKHIVALLLMYVHEPHAFRVIPPLETLLAGCSREQLIALIGEMVQREPELLSVVEIAVATHQSRQDPAGQRLDASAYRRQVRRAMQSENPDRIERELRAAGAAAARVAQAGDWLNAGAIYHVALDEAVRGYDDMVRSMDEDGDIASVIDELAQGLDESLQHSQADAATRREWLTALLEAELTDIELGGIDLAPSAREAVLEHAGAAEWQWIEERIRTAARKSRDWTRSALVELLAEGLEHCGREGDAAALMRELGTPEQQAHLLIDTGQIDAALELIARIIVGKPGLVTQFADALLEAAEPAAALALVREHGSDHWMGRDWLAKYYHQFSIRLQASADWETYMQALRTRYPTLRALHDELHKARL